MSRSGVCLYLALRLTSQPAGQVPCTVRFLPSMFLSSERGGYWEWMENTAGRDEAAAWSVVQSPACKKIKNIKNLQSYRRFFLLLFFPQKSGKKKKDFQRLPHTDSLHELSPAGSSHQHRSRNRSECSSTYTIIFSGQTFHLAPRVKDCGKKKNNSNKKTRKQIHSVTVTEICSVTFHKCVSN